MVKYLWIWMIIYPEVEPPTETSLLVDPLFLVIKIRKMKKKKKGCGRKDKKRKNKI